MTKKLVIHEGQVKNLIHEIRGVKVIFDFDLAQLYTVETKRLKEAVKRNMERFPQDFMFELTKEETAYWRTQFATSNPSTKMSMRYAPMVFTEQGVAMLSGVLKSKRAIEVNVSIMRAFVQMRQISWKYEEVAAKLEDVLEKTLKNEKEIAIIKEMLSMSLGSGNKETKH